MTNATITRTVHMAACVTALATLSSALFAADKAPASERNFVSCPIVLDTPDIPCWVAEYKGERYFLAVQTGRSAGITFVPQLKHQVLVEGTAHPEQPRVCGGIVLSPVKLSVFPDVDPSCNDMRGSEGFSVKGPRPIGPDGDPPGGKSTAVRRTPVDPSQSRGAKALAMKNDAAAGKTREFEVLYFFNSNYLPFPVEQATIDEAADYVSATRGARVLVTGYRGKALLSDGKSLTEDAGLEKLRAEKVAEILRNFGVTDSALTVKWVAEPQHNEGVLDWQKRRVIITVAPSGPNTAANTN